MDIPSGREKENVSVHDGYETPIWKFVFNFMTSVYFKREVYQMIILFIIRGTPAPSLVDTL